MAYYSYEIDNYVKKRRFVPYGLPHEPGQAVCEIGKFYWSGAKCRYYKVTGKSDKGFDIMWQDKSIGKKFTPLNPRKDYELRAFEWKRDISPIDSGISLRFGEIRALCCLGVISGSEREELYNRYSSPGSLQPKGHVYYYIWSKASNRSREKHLVLERDLIKSPRKQIA